MNLFSLFSGIGAFEKALDNLDIPYELTGFSEIDKYAVKSYCAIHDVEESQNYGDITKIDENALPKNIDLITYGFPCQDISLAGKQKGMFNEDGSQTRSGLFFEALRIIEAKKPRVAIAENVKNLTSKKFAEQFKIVLDSLEEAGYNNYWQVLNAKDYGIPQNRERVFIVSIRKDIDKGSFKFPEGFPLELRLKDMLEARVDKRFYLSCKAIEGFNRHAERHATKGNGFGWNPTDGNVIANTLLASANCRPSDNFIEVYDLYNGKQISSDVVGTITTGCSRNASGTFLVREATKKGYAEAAEGDSINLEQPNSKTRRGRVGHGVAQTLTTSPQQGVVNDLRIRKLTPKECFRLMGFDDADFEKAEKVNSNTQLYKQAGNSIVVPVVEYIIKALIECCALVVDKQIEEPITPTQTFLDKKAVTISAVLSASDLAALKQYMNRSKIEYKAI